MNTRLSTGRLTAVISDAVIRLCRGWRFRPFPPDAATSFLAWMTGMILCRVIAFCLLCAASVVHCEMVRADDSLRSLVDRRLAAVSGIASSRCSDAEFLRRVSLDLVGMPPTANEARAFLNDVTPNQRELLVDRLLVSPHYARHMASALDLMLMERRPNTHVTADEWQAWLLKSVRDNKPWNVLAREILLADGDDPVLRPAARFVLDRTSEPNLLTHDVSRIFFGRDMQCAQCHDHPIVADYLQADYQGLLAFMSPGYAVVRKEGDKSITMHAERAGSDLAFESVFIKGTPHRTGARMPEAVVLDEPFFLPGEEYQVAPADGVKSVPKFSRRSKLAELATSGSNVAFNQNIANRLWAHMFGRGLVHPLDLHHPDNPATDPELLRTLSERFVAMNFNIRDFLRELALSDAYQRPFDAPADMLAAATQATGQLPELKVQRPALAESATDSATKYSEATDAWYAAEAATLPVVAELDAARNAYVEAKKKADEVRNALAAVTTQQQSKHNAAKLLTEAVTSAQNAATLLPDDKVLAESVAKLTERAQQLSTEAIALTPMIEEKTTALKPLAEVQDAAKIPIDVIVAKLAPLKAAFIQAETTMLATRRESAIHSQNLTALDKRIETAEKFAQLAVQQQAIATAANTAKERVVQLKTLQRQVAEYAPVVMQAQSQLQAAAESITAATNAMNLAMTEQTRRSELASTIAAAVAATEAAQAKAIEDTVLTDAVAKLKERAAVAQASVAEYQATLTSATTAMSAATETMKVARQALDAATEENTRRQQAMNDESKAVEAANAEVATRKAEFNSRIVDVEDRLVQNFTTSSLKPLTPEQLCWTVFRVTGVYQRYWQAEVAELEKTAPLTDEQNQDAAFMAARNVELEQKTYDKLKGNIGTFVSFYAAAAGQPQGDFFATADQALFAANAGSINSWVVPAADNVADRVIKQTDSRIAAEEIYLSVLTRLPTDDEVADVTAYLAARTADRNVAAQELVWAVLNSAEFRFNH